MRRCSRTRCGGPCASWPRRWRRRCSRLPGAGSRTCRGSRGRGCSGSPGASSPTGAAASGGGTSLRARLAAQPSPNPGSAVSVGVLPAPARLREQDRELLLLIAWDRLEPAEAARTLGLSRIAARVRLHRARKRLAAELDAESEQALAPRLAVGAEIRGGLRRARGTCSSCWSDTTPSESTVWPARRRLPKQRSFGSASWRRRRGTRCRDGIGDAL